MNAISWTRRYVLTGIGAATVAAALPCSSIALTAPDEKRDKIPTKDGNLFYRITGEGRGVPILLIHGGPGGSHFHLTPLADLGKDRPVVFYDQLDCGESDHPNDHTKWTIDRFVSEIDLVREALGLSEVHVLGSSYGGLLAAEYAARQSKGLKSCILAGPVIDNPRWVADCTTLVKLLPAEHAKAILDNEETGKITDNPDYDKANDVFLHRHMCRADPWPPDMKRSFETLNWELSNTMIGPYWTRIDGIYGTYDASPKLAKINVPTLFTAGEFDFVSSGTMSDFHHAVLGSKLYVTKNGSHQPWFEFPDDYNREVAAFLAPLG